MRIHITQGIPFRRGGTGGSGIRGFDHNNVFLNCGEAGRVLPYAKNHLAKYFVERKLTLKRNDVV